MATVTFTAAEIAQFIGPAGPIGPAGKSVDQAAVIAALQGSPAFVAAVAAALGTPAAPPVIVVPPTTGTYYKPTPYRGTGFDWGMLSDGKHYWAVDAWGGAVNLVVTGTTGDDFTVTADHTSDSGSPRAYPSISRGSASNNQGIQNALLAAKYNSGLDFTVAGMKKFIIQGGWDGALSKATTQVDQGVGQDYRYWRLNDIYWSYQKGAAVQWPPVAGVDLMIHDWFVDQRFNSDSGFYDAFNRGHYSTIKDTNGNVYDLVIDPDGSAGFTQGGHTVQLFAHPNGFASPSPINQNQGINGRVFTCDVASLVAQLRAPNPKDMNGKLIADFSGKGIGYSLFPDTLMLNSVNMGVEVDTTTGQCIKYRAMRCIVQDEPTPTLPS